MSTVLRIAFRELRGGLAGFRIFLLCLALGVMAITTVGSVRMAIEEGLASESNAILGGDAAMKFNNRMANETESEWMNQTAERVSQIVDFRSMVAFDSDGSLERSLVQIKGIDGNYPLYGDVGLRPEIPISTALEKRDGLPGWLPKRHCLKNLE